MEFVTANNIAITGAGSADTGFNVLTHINLAVSAAATVNIRDGSAAGTIVAQQVFAGAGQWDLVLGGLDGHGLRSRVGNFFVQNSAGNITGGVGGLLMVEAGALLGIPGLYAWYDYSSVNTLFQNAARTTPITTDGQTVKGMLDRSGYGNHLATETASGPTFRTNIKNGLSVGRHSAAAANQYLRTPSGSFSVPLGGTTPLTIFGVVAIGAAPIDYSTICAIGDGGANGWGIGTNVTHTDALFATSGIKEYANAGGWSNGVFNVHECLFDASADVTWLKDGTSLGTVAGTLFANNPSAGGVFLGAAQAALFWDGDIGELLIFTGDIGVSARASVRAYLRTKWGTP